MHKFAIIILPYSHTLEDDPTSLFNAANELVLPYKIPNYREPKYDELKKPIWDWWTLGGHWNGQIKGLEIEPPGCLAALFPKASGNKDVLYNTAKVEDIPDGLIPQVLVTPKGEWLTDPKAPEEQPASKEPYAPPPSPSDKWERQVRYQFKEHAGYVAVAADIHLPDRPPLLPEWAKGK